MIIIDESNFYNGDANWASEIKIDENETERLRNWAKVDGKYYYIKSNFNKYHEIMGQMIAESLNLDTAKYGLCKKDNYTYYMSPNFKKDNIEYKRVYDLYDNVDEIKNDKLLEDIIKMTALDLFMMQVDRTGYNYLIDNTNNRLAPLYDYSCSYFANSNSYTHYNNYLFNIFLNNKLSLGEFKDKYEKIEDYIEIINDTNYLKLLKEELSKYDVKLDSSNERFYMDKINEGKKIVNKLYRA